MRIEGVFLGISTPGESVSLERKIESSIFLCIPRDLNILGKSCTTFVIVKIVRNLSRGRSPCQRVNHVKSGVIYFSAFIFSYDTIHVYGTIHTWNRDLTDLGTIRRGRLIGEPPRTSPPWHLKLLSGRSTVLGGGNYDRRIFVGSCSAKGVGATARKAVFSSLKAVLVVKGC